MKQSTLRRAGLLALAGSFLLPLSMVQAARPAASSVLLRYHFAQGDTYTYKVVAKVTIGGGDTSGTGGGSLAADALALVFGSRGPVTVSGTVRYHVLSVDASGAAIVEISTSNLTRTTVKKGKPVSTTLRATLPYTVQIGADGSQQGSSTIDMGALGLTALGTLPSTAVAPGSHWPVAATLAVPADLGLLLPPVQVPVTYTFSKVQPAGSQQAAVIDGTGPVQYVLDASSGDAPINATFNGTMNEHVLYGLTTHRLVSGHATVDTLATLGKRRKLGVQRQIPVSMSVTVQAVS
jgi:hypothetical protein